MRNLILVILALIASLKSAHAYIDPGSGSYFLQIIAASLFAAVFAIGTFWKRIKAALAARFSRKDRK